MYTWYILIENVINRVSGFAQCNLRASKLKELSGAIQNKEAIEDIKRYHISLPAIEVYTGQCHKKITLLVHEGATNAQEIRQALREYVQSEFKDYCPTHDKKVKRPR